MIFTSGNPSKREEMKRSIHSGVVSDLQPAKHELIINGYCVVGLLQPKVYHKKILTLATFTHFSSYFK